MTCCDRVLRRNEFHCAACCQTFGTVTLFEAHQSVDRNGTFTGSCTTPEALEMVRDSHGTWQTPEGLKMRQERAERMADVRAAQVRRSTPHACNI